MDVESYMGMGDGNADGDKDVCLERELISGVACMYVHVCRMQVRRDNINLYMYV